MEERRRTRSQGPPSLSENNKLIQWDSLQDPVGIEREQAEAHKLARQMDTATSIGKNEAENSEISHKVAEPHQSTEHMPKSGKISPKEQESGGIPIKSGKISPKQQETRDTGPSALNLGEILQKKTQQMADLAGIGEGIIVNL